MSELKRASIDIGSNSVLLLIAEITNSIPRILDSQSRITSLGRDLDRTKKFHEDSLKLTYNALKEFKDICFDHYIKPEQIIITATEASRVAINATDFYTKIKKELSLDVKIITSDAEAFYSAKGILFPGTFTANIINVLDLGGASSEFIKISTSDQDVITTFSMPVGGVRATDWISNNEFDTRMNSIFNEFGDKINSNKTSVLYVVGGTITSIACMLQKLAVYSDHLINHYKIPLSKMLTLLDELKGEDSASLSARYTILGKRSDSIIGGLKSIIEICKWLNVIEIEVLTYGLRYGTLLEGEIKNEFITSK